MTILPPSLLICYFNQAFPKHFLLSKDSQVLCSVVLGVSAAPPHNGQKKDKLRTVHMCVIIKGIFLMVYLS